MYQSVMVSVLLTHYSTFSSSNFHTKRQKMTLLGRKGNIKQATANENVLPEGPYFCEYS